MADWDDERLAAAFAARAERARSTPSDLAVSVIARIASRPARAAVGLRRAAPGLGLAAAVVVAIAIGAGQLAQTPPASSSSPAASGAASTQGPPSLAPTSTPAVAASVVDELLANPMSVSEAIARRDANLDDTEVAVDGFAWYPMTAIDCIDVIGAPAPFAGCERRHTWLAESADTQPGLIAPQPAGPAFNLFVQPETIGADRPGRTPTQVLVLGHFDDHRAGLCPPERVDSCRQGFVVDAFVDPSRPRIREPLVRVEEFSVTSTQLDTAAGFAGLRVSDPDVVAAFSVRDRTVDRFEPAAVGADDLSGVRTVWIFRWVERERGTRPVLRTRLVADDGPDRRGIGSYEVTEAGLVAVTPPSPSASDGAFATAPTEVIGLQVMDVPTAIGRQTALVRSEIAIRGWYVPPNPRVTCEGEDPLIHPAQPPCQVALQWLLEQAESWPSVSTDQRPMGNFLNAIVPSDVPMPVPDTWADGTAEPWPVVIVGHFNDYRATKYVGQSPFTVDALVWQRDGAVTDGSSVTRLTSDATESPEAALARVENELSPPDVSNRELGPPVLTWTTVVSADQFGVLEPEISEAAPEFLDAHAVWIVRRLVADRWDGQDRLIVDTAYTADAGNRVWLHRADFGDSDLETTLDLGPFGDHTSEVKVYDYDQQVASIRRATAADELAWRKTGPKQDGWLEIARGATPRELAIRWTAAICSTKWRLLVRTGDLGGPGPWVLPQTSGGDCQEPRVTRAIVLTFDHPIDLDKVETTIVGEGSGG